MHLDSIPKKLGRRRRQQRVEDPGRWACPGSIDNLHLAAPEDVRAPGARVPRPAGLPGFGARPFTPRFRGRRADAPKMAGRKSVSAPLKIFPTHCFFWRELPGHEALAFEESELMVQH